MPRSLSWTFTGLTPGSWYEVAVTWPVAGTMSRYASFQVLGRHRLVFSHRYAQPEHGPRGLFTDAGSEWEELGYYYLDGDQLTVQLDQSRLLLRGSGRCGAHPADRGGRRYRR